MAVNQSNILFKLFGFFLSFSLVWGRDYDETEIHGYHFHTYFFQNNAINSAEALEFRDAIQSEIEKGVMRNCRLNRINMEPRGPHPIGSYETCCNKTSISPALSWFMQNHGNLSILLHPLTRWEVLDHTHRSMFLGPRVPLDISVLSEDLGDELDHCLPITVGNSVANHSVAIAETQEIYENLTQDL